MNKHVAAGEQLDGTYRDRWHALAFAIERSNCYYALRKQWFARWALFVPGFALLAGSIALMDVFNQGMPWARPIALAIAAVLAILAVQLRFNSKVQDYDKLIEKTAALDAKMLKAPQTPESLLELELDRRAIQYDLARGVLDVICHNKVVQSWGYPREQIHEVTWWQHFLKQFLTEYRIGNPKPPTNQKQAVAE